MIITCNNCQLPIGEYVTVAGQTWLKVGRLKLKSLHGVCSCGEPFHWAASDRALEMIIERVKARREAAGT